MPPTPCVSTSKRYSELIKNRYEFVGVGAFKIGVILKPAYPPANLFTLLRQSALVRIVAVEFSVPYVL
ncbi:hypothetical protein D3C76_1780180 [compost metagenome]